MIARTDSAFARQTDQEISSTKMAEQPHEVAQSATRIMRAALFISYSALSIALLVTGGGLSPHASAFVVGVALMCSTLFFYCDLIRFFVQGETRGAFLVLDGALKALLIVVVIGSELLADTGSTVALLLGFMLIFPVALVMYAQEAAKSRVNDSAGTEGS